ncbi:hypothetical protein IW139_005819, partial [Coemansia sp. RSA 353]
HSCSRTLDPTSRRLSFQARSSPRASVQLRTESRLLQASSVRLSRRAGLCSSRTAAARTSSSIICLRSLRCSCSSGSLSLSGSQSPRARRSRKFATKARNTT